MQIGMSVRVMNMQVTDGKKGSEKTLSPIPPPRSSLWRLNGHLKSRSDVVIGQNLRLSLKIFPDSNICMTT